MPKKNRNNNSTNETDKFDNNETFEAEVCDLLSDGRGVVKDHNGKSFFVSGVCLGEKGEFSIVALKGKYGEARLVKLTGSSQHRIEPPCSFHGNQEGQCGGCPWMFMAYAEQLKMKQHRVEKTFSKMKFSKGLLDRAIKQILPSDKTTGYRNRVQFKSDGEVLGYVSPNSATIASVDDCIILNDKNRNTLKALRATLPNASWQVTNKKYRWQTLNIDDSISENEVSINKRLPFKQGNDFQNNTMKAWLSGRLNKMDRDLHVVELFCGSGNLTEVIASKSFESITAVEVVDEAIAELDKKSLPNVNALKVDLFNEDGVSKLSKKLKPQILVLDPPRDGMKVKSTLFDKKSSVEHIFYISCDLATLARDVAEICAGKYKLIEVQPLDLFPQTPHVALMVHLRKKAS